MSAQTCGLWSSLTSPTLFCLSFSHGEYGHAASSLSGPRLLQSSRPTPLRLSLERFINSISPCRACCPLSFERIPSCSSPESSLLNYWINANTREIALYYKRNSKHKIYEHLGSNLHNEDLLLRDGDSIRKIREGY